MEEYSFRSRGNQFSRGRGGDNWRTSNSGRTTFNSENRRQAGSSRFGGRREPRKYEMSMGFTFLENLLKSESADITSTLIKERKGFLQLLQSDITGDTFVVIMEILGKVCQSKFDNTKCTVLQSALNEIFIDQLRTFIACLPTQGPFQRRSSNRFWKDPNKFFLNIYEICEYILKILPTFACKSLPVLLYSMKIYIPLLEVEKSIKISDDIKTNVERKYDFIQTMTKEIENNKNAKNDQSIEAQTEPPDDFRQISVYPSSLEVVGGQGFLRENVVKGPYQNVNHYLDVQFRLLREDFVGPLREGITNYRNSVPINHIENVKIHKGVKFLNTEIINEYFCVRVNFASKKKRRTNFETSRRFMFGCLLCFTKDNFQTLFFGKVAQRKIEDLDKGQVIVAFDEKLDLQYNTDYIMVECSVYFEPYFHVLSVLKNMTEDNFPLERYIIRVNPTVQPPEYLTTPGSSYTIEKQNFDPLTEWPNAFFYNFNESQMTAFKAAISQEICVIQGPPGTGKTYLGLKIVQTLLENQHIWYKKSPILVICYTNHALDQFLEGLTPHTKRIIRVGGQSKSTKLDEFNLRNKVSRDGGVYEKRLEVQTCLRTIKQISAVLEEIGYFNSVFSFHLFEDAVPNFASTWFGTASSGEIIDWLLEGAAVEQNFQQLKDHLNTIQAQAELNNINIDDGNEENYDLNSHIDATFDTIFEEVKHTVDNIRSGIHHLITLKALRVQLQFLEDELRVLQQEQAPSLAHLIKEEKLNFEIADFRHKYEYLKTHLSAGRILLNSAEEPVRVDLHNPYNMNYQDRWQLYFYWLKLYKNHESDVLRMSSQDFPEIYKLYEEMREIEDVRIMKDALVIGMTTTCAARLRSSLQTLENPIVVVEEAAEVLEAHIVTSVTKECKHLILIGDHKQLKPNTASYNLGKKYHLGISLFERMLINNIHCYTLNVQHRMRPEISALIRPTIYPFLEDHPSVFQRPTINCIDNCLFFIDHRNPEEPCEGSSKVNRHEVTFFIYLARHLVLNGYHPENITILAAYLGQFFEFQREKKMHADLLKNVRVAVLDNYQGEESDIILLSLVRNNEENKIGFLKIENRICVALSRARNAMYIMGNIDQLCLDTKLWRDIRKILEEQKAIGNALPVRCQIHQDQVTHLQTETDFFAISEGGCSQKCDADLRCGHKCTSLCHIRDQTHTFYSCQIECNKTLCSDDDSHRCKKMCFEECGPCTYSVKRVLTCGHQVEIACHENPITYNCTVMVSTSLPCGHVTDKPCYCDPVTFRCPHICDKKVEPCGHSCEWDCHVRRDPDHLEYQCRKPCAKFLKNCTVQEEDHRCKKMCYQQCDECKIVVRKSRTVCTHMYDVACCEDVDEIECRKPCAKILECGHQCKSKCNEPCPPCMLTVFKNSPICGHPIKVKCSETPNRKYCTKKCPLKLNCGHPCLEKCNEPCTSVCKELIESSGILAECGHVVTRIECHMVVSRADPKLLIKYCQQPCNVQLSCSHLCSGSCGECFQGRIHKRCSQKCGAVLVCDHQCDFPCRQACRPCKRVCSYRCEHSVCGKTCGEVCTPCREPCPRRCVHRKCFKLCGDFCSVPPCTEPCQKMLRCGHQCIGFCGDLCPPKCLVCNKDELLETFFGSESEEARYVLLNDCKHIVESEGMEVWLQGSESQVGYKLCPVCKTAIKTTRRYSDYTKRALIDVAQVKNMTNGSVEELQQKRRSVENTLRILRAKCFSTFNSVCPQILALMTTFEKRLQNKRNGRRQNINKYDLHTLKSKLQIMDYIVNICCDKDAMQYKSHEVSLPQVLFLVRVLSRDPDYIADQEAEDINREIDRLARIVEYGRIKNTAQFVHMNKNHDGVRTLVNDIEKKLFNCKQFEKAENENLKKLLKELNKMTSSGIAISDEERRQILKAMEFSKGHWFKCPNGHIYAIGECGGAMEESRCNECGAKIGGSQHRLLDDNAVATEMDGATHGAWSERENILNYNNIPDFENF